MGGASRIFNVISNTSKGLNTKPSEIISLTVKSKNPLIFIRDDRLEITEEFCVFNKNMDKSKFRVNDIVIAMVMNEGQTYFIQQNDTTDTDIPESYNKLTNKPKINGTELVGNMIIDIPSIDRSTTNLTISNNFKNYDGDNNNKLQAYQTGNTVEIVGIISPKNADNNLNSATETTICTIPSGLRPSRNIHRICQGSGTNIWLLQIKTNGDMTASRYRNSSSYATNPPGTSTWMPINVTYTIS